MISTRIPMRNFTKDLPSSAKYTTYNSFKLEGHAHNIMNKLRMNNKLIGIQIKFDDSSYRN